METKLYACFLNNILYLVFLPVEAVLDLSKYTTNYTEQSKVCYGKWEAALCIGWNAGQYFGADFDKSASILRTGESILFVPELLAS
jgi:hypothetical protein